MTQLTGSSSEQKKSIHTRSFRYHIRKYLYDLATLLKLPNNDLEGLIECPLDAFVEQIRSSLSETMIESQIHKSWTIMRVKARKDCESLLEHMHHLNHRPELTARAIRARQKYNKDLEGRVRIVIEKLWQARIVRGSKSRLLCRKFDKLVLYTLGIDDNELNQALVQHIMRELGYDVSGMARQLYYRGLVFDPYPVISDS